MSKKVLLATEKPFAKAARDLVVNVLAEAKYETVLLESYEGKAPLLSAISEVDAVIIRSDIIDAEVLASAKNLKLVVRAGAGYDNVDCAAAKTRGVAVMNTPGQNANAVAELVFGMMLYMARGKFSGKSGTELLGKTLGIHAVGNVGRHVARIAKGFGMNVLGFDAFVSPDAIRQAGAEPVETVQELYQRSQYISLHIPGNAQTKQSINAALLDMLPPQGCLINTARKEVIHEAELLALMLKRTDLRYATDVSPDATIAQELSEKCGDRYYATPKKMGAQTSEANNNAGVAAAHQIVGFFERGEKQFVVNP